MNHVQHNIKSKTHKLGLSRRLIFCGASCTAPRPCSAFLGGVF